MRKSKSEYNKTYRNKKLTIDPDWQTKENKRYLDNRLARDPNFSSKIKERRRGKERKLRIKILEKLGNKCSNPCCAWINEDGSRGCTDFRCLQIDHKKGGGKKELKNLSRKNYYKKVLADTTDSYQILCANCNWIKRVLNKEI